MPINEQRITDVESEKRVEALLAALRRSRRGTRPPALRLGQTLDEMDAWLADDRQWHQGGPRHWRTLLDDVREALKMVMAMSDSPLQEEFVRLTKDLQTLRGQFDGANDPPDDALRRRLRRISSATRATVLHTDILLSSFRRIGAWASDDPQRAEDGVGVLRDLAELHGHDGVDLLKRVDGVLSDAAWEIAALREEELASVAIASAGASAAERLQLVEKLLTQPARSVGGVVWLEYLQAYLHHPWILSLGPAVTLFAHDVLRSMIHQAPDDERIPAELREDNDDFLKSWLDADNAETAVLADYKVHGDPRVYLRMELDAMPPTRLLAAARETAEFIVAFGALADDNHAIWLLSDSYYVAGHEASTSASMIKSR